MNDKHLDFIQGVINRHNSNSFMIKGWTITICTAIFALAGTWKQPFLSLIAIIPIFVFWRLDSFYLANERCFVNLYNAVTNGNKLIIKNKNLVRKHQISKTGADNRVYIDPEDEVVLMTTDYSMNYIEFKKIKRNNWTNAFFSNTILWFYLMLSFFSIALFLGLLLFCKPSSSEPLKVDATINTDCQFFRSAIPPKTVNNIFIGDSLLKSDTITNLIK